jgi:hypothetical protein
MATVYLARDTRLDRRVAIATDPRFVQFMAETKRRWEELAKTL